MAGTLSLSPHDALLVIDMQNDFMLPGAPLQVPHAEDILPGTNALAACFDHVILTQDWHPNRHVSFASTHPGQKPFVDSVDVHYGSQALWPDHCIQGTPGAALHAGLNIPHAELILRKGFRNHVDSYSAFFENDRVTPTGLTAYLRERSLTRLFFAGLALDFCVGHSAVTAAHLGFQTVVFTDLTRAVDLPGTVAAIERDFAQHGVRCITSADLAPLQA